MTKHFFQSKIVFRIDASDIRRLSHSSRKQAIPTL